jgi:hypothetical protein
MASVWLSVPCRERVAGVGLAAGAEAAVDSPDWEVTKLAAREGRNCGAGASWVSTSLPMCQNGMLSWIWAPELFLYLRGHLFAKRFIPEIGHDRSSRSSSGYWPAAHSMLSLMAVVFEGSMVPTSHLAQTAAVPSFARSIPSSVRKPKTRMFTPSRAKCRAEPPPALPVPRSFRQQQDTFRISPSQTTASLPVMCTDPVQGNGIPQELMVPKRGHQFLPTGGSPVSQCLNNLSLSVPLRYFCCIKPRS